MADVLRLLAHPYRLKIVEVLQKRDAPVHELVKLVGIPQSAVSQHLNAMRRIGLLAAERRGREVWYRIADERAVTVLDCIRRRRKRSVRR